MSDSSERISQRFQQMLEDGRHAFDAAANGLLGGTDPTVIEADLRETSGRIRSHQQEVRRLIVAHGERYGAPVFPSMLRYMSMVKDAERIGDYAGAIFALHVQGASLADARQDLIACKDRISTLLIKARNLQHTQDEAAAGRFLEESRDVEMLCDQQVEQQLRRDEGNGAGPALAWRSFKRVASHAGNIVSGLIAPLDKLDFHPGPPAGRG